HDIVDGRVSDILARAVIKRDVLGMKVGVSDDVAQQQVPAEALKLPAYESRRNVGPSCLEHGFGARSVLLVGRKPQKPAGIFDAANWQAVVIDVKAIHYEHVSIGGHARARHG